jgi:hypothetical protein
MTHRILTAITALLLPLAATAQTTSAFRTVSANTDGTLRSPANFFDANADAILGTVTASISAAVTSHNTSATAHQDIRDTLTQTATTATQAASVASTALALANTKQDKPVAARITIHLEAGQTDAELKLPVGDNYQSGALLLWIHTPDPKGTIITGQLVPPDSRVYYTDSGRPDTRTHRRLDWTTNDGIAYQKSATGQVGSISFVIPVSATIRPDNPALAWVYHRMWVGGHEQDAAGHAIWRIPDQVEWLTVMPSY